MANDAVIGVSIQVDANKLDELMGRVDGMMTKLEQKANTTGKSMTQGFINPFTISMTALLGVVTKSLGAFDEEDRALKKIQGQLKATGYASGMTAKGIKQLSDELEKTTNFEGQSFIQASSNLLRFKNVSSDIFPEVLSYAAGMAEVMGQDVPQSAQVLGKALQDPREATAALKKAGVELTAEQQRQIKAMMDVGNVAGAQKIILGQLKDTYGGVAQESYSSWEQLKIQFMSLFDVLGEQLMPTFRDLAENILLPLIDYIKENKEGFFALGASIAAVGLALTGPLGIVAAIAVAATAIWAMRHKWKQVFVELGIMLLDYVDMFYQAMNKITFGVYGKLAGPLIEKYREFKDKLVEERDKLKAEEKAREEKEEEERKKKAAEGEKNQKKKGSKAAIGNSEAVQEAIKEREEKEKQWKKMYGDQEKFDEKYLKDKEKAQQRAAREELRNERQQLNRRNQLSENFTEKQKDFILSEEQREADRKADLENQKLAFEMNLGDTRMNYTKDLLGNLSSLQNSKTRELFEIGKAASIASATINTYESVTKTMASVPYPFNIPLAIAQGIAGFAQVSSIASTEFALAKGGIATGPTTALLAEAGDSELVLPLNDRGANFMANAMDKIDRGGRAQRKETPQIVTHNSITIKADSFTNGKAVSRHVEKTLDKRKKRDERRLKMVRR